MLHKTIASKNFSMCMSIILMAPSDCQCLVHHGDVQTAIDACGMTSKFLHYAIHIILSLHRSVSQHCDLEVSNVHFRLKR